jgi:hypothetical protein
MKHILALLLLAACAVSAQGQTIKSLGYNTTNGTVVYAGTNPLSFTNTVFFGSDTSINTSSGINYGGSEVINLEERTLVGDWVVAGGLAFLSATNAAVTRTNLSLGATCLTNSNVTNFRAAIGLGATNDVTFRNVSVIENDIKLSTIMEDEGAAVFIKRGTNEDLFLLNLGFTDNTIQAFVPIGFNNNITNAAITRTNLGLSLHALTNTNAENLLDALGITGGDPLQPGIRADRANTVWDGGDDDWGFRAYDGSWRTQPVFTTTNAPSNTTNAALWIILTVGTNAYKLPLFQ